MNDQTWADWNIPPEQVRKGANLLAVNVRRLNGQMSVPPMLSNVDLWVEF
ncbi:MAG: hypothetical protein ACKV22_07300 [Bryobacteraceae bacterium]